MIVLQAPYPHVQTTLILPSPEADDTIEPVVVLHVKTSMDGSISTYIQKSTQFRLVYNLLVTKEKFEELKRFYESYVASRIRVTDWNNRVWNCLFDIDQLAVNFTGIENSGNCTLSLVGERLV